VLCKCFQVHPRWDVWQRRLHADYSADFAPKGKYCFVAQKFLDDLKLIKLRVMLSLSLLSNSGTT
jgi:hypothetical protein